ncbi:N-acetylmannosamine-6-phosphate 2-epimerase [Cellulomonas denverensis]|uniref:Putative N-acetylmannosamine-6-phosphate 2-epimerase n=1 Tax=Cellulomonas denverensis TaxID=264297 RepID=A0A7X6KWG0_9CELL|nr:N-acetylmannosamine-6-phosphate 2-epimerase [Cellulomonas denverensis]NKY23517.1 N-acetylmannosamine-6-phosphate 2-epimerase [Cellulomonas denverensis]GIG24999.1 putative N-acetylmannosamine-6-phosphate 2-epimerase [Cellulomonas denverensis]
MDTLERLRGGLVVSCQAYPGEPMRDPRTTEQVARSAVRGGAVGIRVQGLADIAATVAAVDVPVVGLWKDGDDPVFLTPTLRHALAVAEAGAQVVALDGTRRPRPDGLTLAATVRELRAQYPGVAVMADCGSLPDALAAQEAGVHCVGTTLAGYTEERPRTEGPDIELVDQMVAACTVPVVVEGRVHRPEQAAEVMARGAFCVCVGTAITHPATITSWFVQAIDGG